MIIARFLVILSLSLVVIPNTVNAASNKIVFTKTQYLESGVRTVSIYVKLKGSDAENLSAMTWGVKRRSYVKVWDNLYLNITSEAYTGVTEKPFAFYLSFSSDEEGMKFLMPVDQPSHGPSEDLIRATDLEETARHQSENQIKYFDIKQWNLTESRIIEYEKFTATLRILEFESTPTKKPEVVAFENLSLIIEIKENVSGSNKSLKRGGR